MQLRDQILALRNGQCFVVGITSDADALPAKSVLAVRLSMLLAESSARVLVVETNFDFPTVHRVLGIDMPRLAGFSQQIHARIRSGERPPWKVVRCTANLDVLGEGFMRSPGVSFSREFSEAISELRRGYDFIVADGPTASAGADCKPLNSFADGLVVAVRPGAKLADAIERAAQWFTRKELMAAVFVDVK
jgi:Mrp family chromosome partitioning ATPase